MIDLPSLIWQGLTWLANANMLITQWNSVVFVLFAYLSMFTSSRLKLYGFSKFNAMIMSFALVATFVALIDMAGMPVAFIVYHITPDNMIMTKLQQWLTAFVGVTLVWTELRQYIQLSKLTIAALLYEFCWNVPMCIWLNFSDYRAFAEPLRTEMYLAFYLPACVVWAIAYIGLWKRAEQTK